ncbi:ABC transporter ATP-binding protein [Calothrix sp. UHCC 0171]|uniref:ABC transporter ATP-binding protein n=1 Tax=Calothrix sp. UHCC 0171 TaxID=3110245 RepID=UPI002B1F21EA|nr:ATP-binding cassette domain-containing protein [Calothrix sp. UHCC 0171]MEA5572398.1 ATP-binding cassette domain-containing protein [Calothrix sp. UHCC 0171]
MDILDTNLNTNLDRNTALIRLEQVSLFAKLNAKAKNIPGYSILQDISFEAIAGSCNTIVGATGAGKTFLLRLLNRLCEPTSGKIYFQNRDYQQIPILELRASIVLVPQEPKLLGMTVKDALAYPLILRKLPKSEIQKRVNGWIEKLQISDDCLGRNELQLSLGQRQLCAIARALVIQPQVLLLDEPTAALDIGTAERLMQILSQLSQTQNLTVIMVNHQLELLQEFYSHSTNQDGNILHLSQGRLLSNQKALQVDWNNLKTSIIQAETEDDFI